MTLEDLDLDNADLVTVAALGDSDIDALAGAVPDNEANANATPTDGKQPEAASESDKKPYEQGDDQKASEGTRTQQDQKPDGVLAKDNQHVLPYAVVEDLRRQNDLLAKQLKDMQAAKPVEGKPAVALPEGMITDEQLEALDAEVPELARTMRAMRDQIQQLHKARADEVHAREESANDARRRELVDAIAANPKLEFVRASNPEDFKAIQQIDVALMANPISRQQWMGKPLADRFAHVVQLFESTSGKAIAVPSATQQPADAKPTPDKKAIDQQTAKDSATKQQQVASLSDIPGGSTPAADSREELAQKSGAAIAADLAKLSPEQLDQYMASLIS